MKAVGSVSELAKQAPIIILPPLFSSVEMMWSFKSAMPFLLHSSEYSSNTIKLYFQCSRKYFPKCGLPRCSYVGLMSTTRDQFILGYVYLNQCLSGPTCHPWLVWLKSQRLNHLPQDTSENIRNSKRNKKCSYGTETQKHDCRHNLSRKP